MTTQTNETAATRRCVMAALMALPAAPALAEVIPGMATDETPVRKLFREWATAYELAETKANEATDEELDRMLDTKHQLELRIMQTQSQSPLDVLCKVAAWTSFGMFELSDPTGGNRVGNVWHEMHVACGVPVLPSAAALIGPEPAV